MTNLGKRAYELENMRKVFDCWADELAHNVGLWVNSVGEPSDESLAFALTFFVDAHTKVATAYQVPGVPPVAWVELAKAATHCLAVVLAGELDGKRIEHDAMAITRWLDGRLESILATMANSEREPIDGRRAVNLVNYVEACIKATAVGKPSANDRRDMF